MIKEIRDICLECKRLMDGQGNTAGEPIMGKDIKLADRYQICRECGIKWSR